MRAKAAQLNVVARMIAGRTALGTNRQVFLVSLGGFDNHDKLLTDQNTNLGQVSAAMGAFDAAMQTLSLGDAVTVFTESDFSRTNQPNTSVGSDHAWGSHHMILGGAVKGGDIYGRMPTLTINGPDDTSQGRWIPSTSVDEYSATLARWFGVSASNLSVAFPNLGRFANPNLGFV